MEISNKWLDWGIHAVMQQIVTVVAILIIAFILDYVCRRGIIPIIRKIVRKTKIEWDDYLLNDKVLNNACHLIPPIVIYLLLPLAFPPLSPLLSYLLMFLQIYIVVVTVRLINAVISSLYELSNRSDKLKDRPLKFFFHTGSVICKTHGYHLPSGLHQLRIDLTPGIATVFPILNGILHNIDNDLFPSYRIQHYQ